MSETVMSPETIRLNNPELVVFDFDRTLFDVDRFWDEFLTASAELWGVDRSALDATHKVERGHGEVYDAFSELEALIGQEMADDDIQALGDKLHQHASNFLVEGATEAFRAAQATALVYVVTVGDKRFQEFKFNLIQDELTGGSLPDGFTCMEGSKGEYIVDIANRMNIAIKDVAYIDDRPRHINSVANLAKQGLQVVWFDSPAASSHRLVLSPKDDSIQRISTLENIVFYEEQFDAKAS